VARREPLASPLLLLEAEALARQIARASRAESASRSALLHVLVGTRDGLRVPTE